MATDVLTSPGTEIRENLVTTAVKFLSNPNVQRCTLESKERFLRSKGLSEAEILRAIEKCGDILDVPSLTSELMFFQHSRRSWFRERILPLIVYGGFVYGCYWFYKNCLRHLLFVEQPKRKTTAECIDELRKSLDVMNASVSSLRGEIQSSVKQNALRSQLDNLKADIASVKGILLNSLSARSIFPMTSSAVVWPHMRQPKDGINFEPSRGLPFFTAGSQYSASPTGDAVKASRVNRFRKKSRLYLTNHIRNQFPSLKTRTEAPSIPAWQRQSEEATSTEVEDKKKTHRTRSQRSESGGSNSSEGEQATKNSDSSLEIIT